ncbi:MAG: ribonuclease HII [Bacteroidetes bacterium]|nr:MAG: ribonuclease HII [Bacteroidota bacterium]
MPATLEIESSYWKQGYTRVAGIDEAGRGCLAGPVVAAAVILPPGVTVPGVADSKTLSPARRDALAQAIQRTAVAVGVGLCTPEEIDRMNILRAALEAMRRAAAGLSPAAEVLLIDGNRGFPDSPWPYETLVRGDRRCHAVAAASIIAKTTRDHLMADLHRLRPCYGWAKNKGYPTKDHYDALAAHGPSPFHRRSFRLSR